MIIRATLKPLPVPGWRLLTQQMKIGNAMNYCSLSKRYFAKGGMQAESTTPGDGSRLFGRAQRSRAKKNSARVEDYNAGTQKISNSFTAPIDWKDPDVLSHFIEIAPGWFESENIEGRKFYYNLETDSTQWKHPFSGEISLPPEKKKMFQKTVLGEFKIRNKLQKPHPGQTPWNNPDILPSLNRGTQADGKVHLHDHQMFIFDGPNRRLDQIGLLHQHAFNFEEKLIKKELELPKWERPIDDRPREITSWWSVTKTVSRYAAYSTAVLWLGGFIALYRSWTWRYNHNLKIYDVKPEDRVSRWAQYKWLLGMID